MALPTFLRSLDQAFKDTDFVEDAKRVASVEEEDLSSILTTIAAEPDFPSNIRLDQVAQVTIADRAVAKAVSNFIRNITRLRFELGMEREEYRDELVAALKRAAGKLGDQTPIVVERARAIAEKRMPRLETALKARLLAATGDDPSLVGISVRCDIRPVFNESRDNVEAVVPVASLTMSYTTGIFPTTVSLRVDVEQLEALALETERAVAKLRAMRKFIATQGLPSPMAKNQDEQ